jgi:hypothetical protein
LVGRTDVDAIVNAPAVSDPPAFQVAAKYFCGPQFVYDAIDKDIGKKLRELNPDPHFQQNHHQWLKEFGRQKVHDQIERVVTIMKLCDNMDDFRAKFARVFKKSAVAQMSFNWDQP